MLVQRKVNPIKQKIKNGEVVFGTCLYSFCPNIMEIAGYCGLDFCRIDNEHSWRQDHMIEHVMRAGEIANILPIPRVDKNNPYLIRKVLEIGGGGFLIPEIKNEKEVEAIIRASKFPPLGERGYSPLCFSGNYGITDTVEWVKWSNEQILVGVMIETPEAVENLDKIMKTDGLDFVYFGAADFSIKSGLDKPNKNHPTVRGALKKTIEVAKENGKHVMTGVGYPWNEEAEKYIEMGCTMIEIGHDYSVLSTIWKKTMEDVKGKKR